MRGASSAKVMEIIMDDLAKATGESEAQVHEHFNMLGGTSAGGLIAIMLGRLRVAPSSLLHMFSSLSGRLFRSKCKLVRTFFTGSIYSGRVAEREFRKIVSEYASEGGGAPLFNAANDGCDVVVTAVDTEDAVGAPILFTTYDDTPHTIVDAARATSAAPSFFPACELKTGQVAVDGGVGNNNPTERVLTEARKRYGSNVKFDLFLSIGTGSAKKVTMKKCTGFISLLSLSHTLASIVTDSEAVHERVTTRFTDSDMGTYLRINVPGIGDVRLDDYKSIPALIRTT